MTETSSPSEVRVSRNKLVLCQYIGEEDFEVDQSFNVYWLNYIITIHVGFATDLASKPIGRKSGKWNMAAIVHDFLYHGGEVRDRDTGVMAQPTQHEADRIFRDLMKYSGVDEDTYTQMYAAVRIFGHFTWDKYHDH